MDDTLPEGKVSSMTVCGSLRRQSVSPRNGSLAQTLYGRSSIGAGAFAAITTQALSTDRAELLRAGPGPRAFQHHSHPSGWRCRCPLRCRSEEYTSELQSLMSISYAVYGLK